MKKDKLIIFLITILFIFNGCTKNNDFYEKYNILQVSKLNYIETQESDKNLNEIIDNIQLIDNQNMSCEIITLKEEEKNLINVNYISKETYSYNNDILYINSIVQQYATKYDYFEEFEYNDYYTKNENQVINYEQIITKSSVSDVNKINTKNVVNLGISLNDMFPQYNYLLKNEIDNNTMILNNMVNINGENYYHISLKTKEYDKYILDSAYIYYETNDTNYDFFVNVNTHKLEYIQFKTRDDENKELYILIHYYKTNVQNVIPNELLELE